MNQFPFNKLSLIKSLNSAKNSARISRAQSKQKNHSSSNDNFKKFAKSSHPEKFFVLTKDHQHKKSNPKIKITKRKNSKQKTHKQINSKSF